MKRFALLLSACALLVGSVSATEQKPVIVQSKVTTEELRLLMSKVPGYENRQEQGVKKTEQVEEENEQQQVAQPEAEETTGPAQEAVTVARATQLSQTECDPCNETPIPPFEPVMLVQNPNSPIVAFYPQMFGQSNSAENPPQKAEPIFSAGDRGTNPSATGDLPSNYMGVIGQEQFLAGTNQGLVSFTRDGVADNEIYAEAASFLGLDGGVGLAGSAVSPRLRYDHFTDRFVVMYAVGIESNFGLSIAVSDRGVLQAETRWNVITILNLSALKDGNGCTGQGMRIYSNPTLGIDNNAFYIGIDVEVSEGTVTNRTNDAFVIPKKSLLKDEAVVITPFRDVTGFNGVTRLVGVDNFDKDAEFGYFISTHPREMGSLLVFKVCNPSSRHPRLTNPITVVVPTTGFNDFSEQGIANLQSATYQGNIFGDPGNLSTGRVNLEMAHVRHNQLFTSHTTAVDVNGIGTIGGDRLGIRWYQLDLAGNKRGRNCDEEQLCTVPVLVQAGILWDARQRSEDPLVVPNDYYYSAIMTNVRGDLTIAGNVSGVEQPSSAFFVGRFEDDQKGTLRIGGANNVPNLSQIVFETGTGTYFVDEESNAQPWGLYSYTSLDPKDDLTMWTIQAVAADNLEKLTVAQLKAPVVAQ